MLARTLFFDDKRALTTGRRAEFGFLGVTILNRKTTPLRCGDFANFGLFHL